MAAVRSFVREDVFLQPVPAIKVDEAFVREWRRERRRDRACDRLRRARALLVKDSARPGERLLVLSRATSTATLLADVVRKQKLTVTIQGREHARVEAWTLLGSMLGVFPVCVWTREIEGGWEARVEARTRDGAVVGAAEAMCVKAESTWKNRDAYALRSMAQTRATSKALRQPLGFVMQLAGFDATPAEEMPRDREPQRADAPYDADDPASVRVHFGKNTDTRVGDLTQRQREWYAGEGWAENKAGSGREVTEQDRRLRRAARILTGAPAFEQDGPFGDVAF